MNKKIVDVVMALALVVIAANMTYSNKHSQAPEQPKQQIEEKIFPVIGRVTWVFDGVGATAGFLVKDGESLKVVSYDQGSRAADPAYQPKYLSVITFTNGNTVCDPITVEEFHN